MANEWASIDLADRGGIIRFSRLEDFEAWIERERLNWEWALEMSDGGVAGNTPSHIQSLFTQHNNFLYNLRVQAARPEELERHMSLMYKENPAAYYYSKGEVGQSILAVREELGVEAALLAYAIMGGVIRFDARDHQHFRLLTLVHNPQLLTAEARRSAARASFRAIVTESEKLVSDQKAKLEDVEKRFAQIRSDADAFATSQFRRKLRTYVKARRKGWHEARRAIRSIEATDEAFQARMELQAAVSYWANKASKHEGQLATQKATLINYICKGGFGAAVAFVLAFMLMLEMSGVNSLPVIDLTPNDTQPLSATPFILIAGFLGTALTALIWAARILVRNYLTERHLIADAEERRVMTMTYLALVNEGAALPQEDRLVILNALFRQATDASSSDDASYEVAFPALMARLIDRK